ncbi:MAG: hypothetical protein JWR75_2040 [Devosia sp.]|nr:hypothetical protein [Devosia sp.]
MKKIIAMLMLAACLPLTGAAFAQMPEITATFADATWNGETVPAGQNCPLQGGAGATPALMLTGVPELTTAIRLSFNDETYQPMNDGGHGVVEFAVTPDQTGAVELPSVPGNTAEGLPDGVTIAAAARSEGDYASAGYLPPCSGGQGNTYSANITALNAAGDEIGQGKVTLGKY